MKRSIMYLSLAVVLATSWTQAQEPSSKVAFRLGKKHSILLPVKVANSVDAEFLLNTGLGFNLLSPQFAQKLGIKATSSYKVQPVTGGELELAQAKLSSLTVGNRSQDDQDIVIGEPLRFVGKDGETRVDGILSLAFFKNHPFTIDYTNQKLILEDESSLAKRKAAGKRVECQLADELSIASVSLLLKEREPEPAKPGGFTGFISSLTGGGPPEPPKAWVRVDTGCEKLLLDSKLIFALRIDDTGTNITESETTDQNGVKFRSFASQMGKVELADQSSLTQEKLPVVFRKLQVPGILGQNFLQNYTVTFNLPDSELYFAK